MEKSMEFGRLEEIFEGNDKVRITGDGLSAYAHVNGVWTVFWEAKRKEIYVLGMRAYRKMIGNYHAEEYKRALLELQKQGYRIIRNNSLEPSLARMLI